MKLTYLMETDTLVSRGGRLRCPCNGRSRWICVHSVEGLGGRHAGFAGCPNDQGGHPESAMRYMACSTCGRVVDRHTLEIIDTTDISLVHQ
jgi:hypothetical protein